MKSKTIGYIGVDSGAIVIGDAGLESVPLEDGPFGPMKHIKRDAPVAKGFVLPTVIGDGVYEVVGHFIGDEMVSVTIDLTW